MEGTKYDTVPGTLYITGPHVRHSIVPDPEDPLSEYCIYLKLSDKGVNDKRRLSPMSAFRLTTVWYGRDR